MEFLLELFSEEIPARMQAAASEHLAKALCDGLTAAGFGDFNARHYVTPRRLTVVIDGLPDNAPAVSEERRGPRADAPAPAMAGFLKANNVTLEQCEQRETAKGKFLFVTVHTAGRPTVAVLGEIIAKTLATFPWPKSQRWGERPERWVRPLHSILALFGGHIVPVEFAGIVASNTTRGHRFLAPAVIKVAGFADYATALRAAFVILDPAERRAMIEAGATALAALEGLTQKPDEGLLREVLGLVEWPVPLMGQIDEAFMGVPPEVLSTSMRSHQKYFSLLKADGSLAPRFIVVANMQPTDGGVRIVAGNERVLRARLSDARFFWDQDRKVTLESRVAGLKDRVFYAGLGSVYDKAVRLTQLSDSIAGHIGADQAAASRAALLAKADLSSGMVGEFPELQGLMGRYYALNDKEAREVANAIAEHYSPAGPSDKVPTAPVSVALALADKVDTLVGFFSVGEKPTGSKDPYALRRAALGIVRIILENDLRVSPATLFEQAARGYHFDLSRWGEGCTDNDELVAFINDRLAVYLRDKGYRHDLVAAVQAVPGGDLVSLTKRAEAVQAFLASDDAANLLAGYKRAANIRKIEEKKDGRSHAPVINHQALHADEEKALCAAIDRTRDPFKGYLEGENFAAAMTTLAALREPLDSFFDKVIVNADEPATRINRLGILASLVERMNQIADFSKIEG